MVNQWQSLGEVTVTDSWQLFPELSIGNDVFRITTTVSPQDWENKVRSGAYIKFRYETGFNSFAESKKLYIPISEHPIIYEFPIPKEFRSDGIIIRSISCILSSRYVGKFSLASFIGLSMMIEESEGDGSQSDREIIQRIALDVAAIKELIGG